MLVERAAELAALTRAVTAAGSGSGRFILLNGPPGAGKTSLLAEAARLASEAGVRVLTAHGMERERELAFGVVRQLFGPILSGPARGERLLAGAAAAAASALGEPHPDGAAPGDFAVLHGLYWLTANVCRGQPHLLVIDDLQWGDRWTLRYLTYLQPRVGELALAVVAAFRPDEPHAEYHLLDLLTTDPAVTLLHPQPLSADGAAALVNRALGTVADRGFLAMCHTVTGGSPLLLRQLAEAIAADGMAATAGNAERVANLVPRELGSDLERRIARLPEECGALAAAVAVLGDDVPLHHATALARLEPQRSAHAVQLLRRVHILDGSTATAAEDPTETLRFVRPLVRTAVYDRIGAADRLRAHAAAAALLYDDPTSDPERIAAHLLRVPPASHPDTVGILRQASGQAAGRGSPETAVAYLRRALQEPLSGADRADLEEEAGRTAQAVDNDAAAQHLERAHALVTEPARRARIAQLLGTLYLQLLRLDEADQTCNDAMAELPDGHGDIASLLHAGLLGTAVLGVLDAERQRLADRLGRLPFHDSLGGRALESLLGGVDLIRNEPTAVERGRRALTDGVLLEMTPGEPPLQVAWLTLVYADDPDAFASLDAGVAQAHHRGATRDLAAALTGRALARLRRGDLAGAESDGRECAGAIDASHANAARPFLGAYLAESVLEQGRTAEAQAAIDWIGLPDPPPPLHAVQLVHLVQAALHRTTGRVADALALATETGRRAAGTGGDNPSMVAWRSEAALCLLRLNRAGEAHRLVADELASARHWGGPLAIGRALRVAGLLQAAQDGRDAMLRLRESADILGESTARLEYAKSLVGLGTALHRAGQHAQAKDHLARGLDLAHHCGAAPLAGRAEAELRATGARPRRRQLTGAAALTASELRVAELAATGHTNRDIAQQLFITVKTVEIHLGNVYRKLGISRRHDLAEKLASTPTPAS